MITHPPRAPRPKIFPIALVLGALLIVALFVLRIYPGRPDESSQLKRINIVPPFALTERSGKTITNNDLFGKIWVADFVYTTCPGPCPLITASMAKVQAAVAHDANVQLVTFSVDPANDTPEVLAAYADHFGADKNRWWFLTGAEKPVYALIRDGFFQAVEDNRGKPPEPGQFVVTHSTQLALVDANGVVRGFFDGLTPEGRKGLLKAIALLEQEKS
jgi:cytochrome oxidase Cu insertion factor (SCO1/SenC/PrrC family)